MANQDLNVSMSSISQEVKNRYANEEGFINTLPPIMQKVGLDNCHNLPYPVVEFGRNWAKTFPLRSLFFCGTCGSGKTWFAHALIREVFKNIVGYWWPKIITSPSLDSKLLKASKSDEGDAELIRMYADEDLLMIDDLGRESKSDRLKRQYYELFNQRYLNQKPTIVTSNFELNELSEVLDGAVISRMQGWKMINFPKKDLRKLDNILNVEEL